MVRLALRSTISTFFYLFSFFRKREGVVVLMYHRVNDALPPSDLVMPVAKFREQMEYLKQRCEVVGIEALLQSSDELSAKSYERRLKVAITFDDGYTDNYVNAYPVLKELKLPATVFLITGMIGTDKKRPRYESMPSPDMLSWKKVTEMAQDGISFGVHTVSHPHLPQLSYEAQKKEIEESRAVISSWVSPQQAFCYPYGDYNEDTLEILRDLGFRLAVTIRPGINDGKVDPLELHRTEMNGIDSMFDFKKKLAGAFDWLHEMVQKGKAGYLFG